MQILLNPNDVESYRTFLAIKELPAYRIRGRVAEFPDEYAKRIGAKPKRTAASKYAAESFMFDYQRDIADLAIRRQKFAVFADCGLGKTLILLSYARHVQQKLGRKRRVLIISPPLVIYQTIAEAAKFWGNGIAMERVKAADLPAWLASDGDAIGITNYEALKDETPRGKLGALILDESSILKSHYGNYAGICLRLGAGLDWKLCATGTPAPNDRIEYANHAVFLDRFPTVNSFLATYFVNRGQTDERWELKPHALRPFYRSLSDWCIFLSNPATYGWKDNVEPLPPIHTHIEHVPMTPEQDDWVRRELGTLIAVRTGGITHRAAYGQVAKGHWKGQDFPTLKYDFMRDKINSWRAEESTLVWCLYDNEQDRVEESLPYARGIRGKTPMWQRRLIVEWFCRRICDCELERRLKCGPSNKEQHTTTNTTARTKASGSHEPQSKGSLTTESGESSTPQTQPCESNAGRSRGDGRKAIPTSDSHSDYARTDSRPTNTAKCSNASKRNAPSAAKGSETTPNDSTSITAIQQDKCEGCCAPNAITHSASSATALSFAYEQQTICCCTPEQLSRGRTLVSKPSVLGFGLNLQVATRQVFSGLQDSYEAFYQCVKRSNRIGSTKPLNVHIPATDIEMPMIENVLRKMDRVEADTKEQEAMFQEASR